MSKSQQPKPFDNNNRAEGVLDDVSAKLRDAGRVARNFADDAQENISGARASVEEQIRANPMSAAAICVGAGVLLSFILRRR